MDKGWAGIESMQHNSVPLKIKRIRKLIILRSGVRNTGFNPLRQHTSEKLQALVDNVLPNNINLSVCTENGTLGHCIKRCKAQWSPKYLIRPRKVDPIPETP